MVEAIVVTVMMVVTLMVSAIVIVTMIMAMMEDAMMVATMMIASMTVIAMMAVIILVMVIVWELGAVGKSVEHGSREREIVGSNPCSSQTNDLYQIDACSFLVRRSALLGAD